MPELTRRDKGTFMVDRKARARLRTWLTQLLDGDIDEGDFAVACEEFLDTEDRSVIAIAVFFGMFEEDLPHFDSMARDRAESCRRFLATDAEYRWPPFPGERLWVANVVYLVNGVGWMAISAAALFFFTASFNLRLIAVESGFLAIAAAAWWLSGRLVRYERERNEQEFRLHGHHDAWPFLTIAEYHAAASQAEHIQYPPEPSLPLSPSEEFS
jgi:hypothetical protein